MAYLITTGDINTHIYAEIITEITRGDIGLVEKGIAAAISEAKSYCSRFDRPLIFGTETSDPVIQDENLNAMVKDMAVWRIAKLCNPNIQLELLKTGYDDAKSWFKKVQSGDADPEGWPYKPPDENGVEQSSPLAFSSNRKRSNHW